jgi:hypothetical protein
LKEDAMSNNTIASRISMEASNFYPIFDPLPGNRVIFIRLHRRAAPTAFLPLGDQAC